MELLCRPRATEHYVNYLKQNWETDKLIDLLGCVAVDFRDYLQMISRDSLATVADTLSRPCCDSADNMPIHCTGCSSSNYCYARLTVDGTDLRRCWLGLMRDCQQLT